MVYKPLREPHFLENCTVLKVADGRKVWKSSNGKRLYTWDELHGEIEVFNKRGKHLGSADKTTGIIYKDAVKGRELNV